MRSKGLKRNKAVISYQLSVISILLFTVHCSLFTDYSYALPWSWDMFTQPSHKAQEKPPLKRPENTVQFNKTPLNLTDRASSAGIKNPVVATEASIQRGRLKYNTYCATCHGDMGKGDGLVGQKYVPPTDLSGEYVQSKSAGDIFYTITKGGLAIMPSYRDSILEEDRWHIVNYIKDAFGPKKAGGGK